MSDYQKDMAKYIVKNGIINGKTSYWGSWFRKPEENQIHSDSEELAQEHTDDWEAPKCGGWKRAYDLEEFYEEVFAGTFTEHTDKSYAVRIKADCDCGAIKGIPIVVNGTFEEVLHGVLGIDTSDVNLLD